MHNIKVIIIDIYTSHTPEADFAKLPLSWRIKGAKKYNQCALIPNCEETFTVTNFTN